MARKVPIQFEIPPGAVPVDLEFKPPFTHDAQGRVYDGAGVVIAFLPDLGQPERKP